MPQKLIIIRGNSGSGKSTIARRVRDELGERVMLLQQDVLRRDILKVKDVAGNPTIGLIEQLALYGKDNGYDVVLEGILSENKYGDMLRGLLKKFNQAHVYYLDVSLEETIRRHSLRHNSEFGEAEMREWWKEKDYLAVDGEVIFDESFSEDEVVDCLFKDMKSSSG